MPQIHKEIIEIVKSSEFYDNALRFDGLLYKWFREFDLLVVHPIDDNESMEEQFTLSYSDEIWTCQLDCNDHFSISYYDEEGIDQVVYDDNTKKGFINKFGYWPFESMDPNGDIEFHI